MSPELKKLALGISKIGLSASLLLSACQENKPISESGIRPNSPPTATIDMNPLSSKDKLSQGEKEIVVDQILKPNNYSEAKIGQIENLIRIGTNEDQLFELENKSRLFVRFSKLTLLKGTDLSATTISLGYIQGKEEKFTSMQFSSSINERIISGFSPSLANNLVQREATGIYLQMLAITEMFKLRGIDLSQSFDPQMQKLGISESEISALVNDLLELIGPYTNSISQMQEDFGLLKLVDRTETGTIRFIQVFDRKGVFTTTVGGRTYDDNGKFYLTLKLIGDLISQFSNISELQKNYISIKQIPGWDSFHLSLNGVSGNLN